MLEIVSANLSTVFDEVYQVVLPEVDGYLQYTCASYNKSVLPLLEEKLVTGEFALYRIIREVIYRSVRFTDEWSFLNVNTMEDLGKLRKMLW